MKGKRLLAYIIDVIVIALFTSVICMLPMFNDAKNAQMEFAKISSNILTGSGSSDPDEEALLNETYKYTKETISIEIINITTTILYFAIVGYCLKGVTLGKKIMNIKIVSNDDKEINPGLYFLREILKTSTIFNIINVILITYISKNAYLNITNYLSYAQEIFLLIIVGTMIFRDDERGLHDVICNTKVISTKKQAKEEIA